MNYKRILILKLVKKADTRLELNKVWGSINETKNWKLKNQLSDIFFEAAAILAEQEAKDEPTVKEEQ